MQSSRSETTSSSDTTEHPGDLTISDAPGRKGTYLYIEHGSAMHAIARFMNEVAVEHFREWARTADELGLKIQWDGNGEEGDSEEQA